MNGEDLFIEPIKANANNSHPNEHKITKRSVHSLEYINRLTNLQNKEHFCGTSGNSR